MHLLRNAVSSIDLSLALALAVCVAASMVVLLVPVIRSITGLLVIAGLSTAAFYRSAATGFILINIAVYFFIIGLNLLGSRFRVVNKNRWRFSCAAMLCLLVLFLLGRYLKLETQGVNFQGATLFFFSLNMWAFLRLITLLWEFGSGRIERPSFGTFVIWIGLPFTLLGPILRYSQFEKQLPLSLARSESARCLPPLRLVFVGLIQLSLGLLLTGFQFALVDSESGLPHWEKLVIGFSLAPWSFYLLWAGYFKLMESLAPFWGITLPPSFNRPFGRRNLSEFWANWNMTATSVFRDYFFYNRWGLRKANLYVNTLIVFLMVGLWHGLNGYWILWGLMHGIGFCAYLWYSTNRTRLAVLRQNVIQSQFRFTGPIATYLYVCSCWFLPPTILKFIR